MKYVNIFKKALVISLAVGVLAGINVFAGCTDSKESENDKTATIEFDSFDGGGPEYTAVIEDENIISVSKEIKYNKPDHDEIDGAGYKVIYTITGKKPGKTRLTVSCTMQGVKEDDMVYDVTVADDNKVTVESVQE